MEKLNSLILAAIKGADVVIPDIMGQDKTKRDVLSAILSGRHIIIKGYPGVGKTTLAKAISDLLPEINVVSDCPYHCDPEAPVCPQCLSNKNNEATVISGKDRFIRVQGSPDLQAEDLLGDIDPIKALQFGPTDVRAFTPGKLLKANRGVLFFDEINRCPERLQNALLQVLEEGIATIGGYDVDYPSKFILIATMNPSEYVGTEKLSEVLLDRFDTTEMFFPESTAIEKNIVKNKGQKIKEMIVSDDILNFIIAIVRNLRKHEDVERPPGVRATLGLYERVQTNALLKGFNSVTFDDIEDVLFSVLGHRVKLAGRVSHVKTPEDVITEVMSQTERDFAKKKMTKTA